VDVRPCAEWKYYPLTDKQILIENDGIIKLTGTRQAVLSV